MNKCFFAILCISCLSPVVFGKRISTKNTIERHRQAVAATAAGDVETALLLAQTQLEDELAKHHKKNQHEKEEIAKWKKEIKAALEIVGAWTCKYFGVIVDWVYKDYCSHLEKHQLPYLEAQVASSQKDVEYIDATIVRLDEEVHQTLTDVTAAKAEEGLIAKLNLEMGELGHQRDLGLDANGKMEAAQKQKGDNKISAFDEELRKLLEALKITTAEHALLTQEHTGGLCADKEQKGETICKRCSEGKACGDDCISSDEHCWYDAGCSCMTSAADPPSFLQVESHAHPLREKLNQAKAVVRKVIAAEQDKIDNLETQLATSDEDIAAAKDAKLAAEQKFKGEIAQEKKTHDLLTAAQDAAMAEKAKLTAQLDAQKAEGAEQVANLVAELKEGIQKLKNDIVQIEHQKSDMMEANAASMNVLKDKHAAQINDIVIEIQKLQHEKEDAQGKLDAIQDQHGLSA